jgi:hypothetical protein
VREEETKEKNLEEDIEFNRQPRHSDVRLDLSPSYFRMTNRMLGEHYHSDAAAVAHSLGFTSRRVGKRASA